MTLIALREGRQLDIEVSGPDDGVPLVFHHGTPGAVPQVRVTRRAALAHGWRLVTYSRAGYGGSTRKPGRQVVDVVADVEAILDHLAATAGEAPLRTYPDKEAEQLREAKPADIVTAMDTLLPDVDRAMLTDEFGEDLAAGLHDALRTGIDVEPGEGHLSIGVGALDRMFDELAGTL